MPIGGIMLPEYDTRPPAKGARGEMRLTAAGMSALLFLVIVAIAFSDGTHDRMRHHYRCKLGALKRFPDQYLTFDQTNNANMYLQDCMGALGYLLRNDAPECPPTLDARIWFDHCYRPTSYPAKWRQQLEAVLGY